MPKEEELKEFNNKLFDGKINRRDFVKLCGLLLILETYENKGKIVESIWSRIKKQSDFDYSNISDLFGTLQNDFKFTLGTSHYLYKGQIHPADKAAAITLGKVTTPGLKNIETIGEQFLPNLFNGNYICIGSPTTNLLSRYIMQYKIDESNNYIVRSKEPSLDLEFEYILDKTLLREYEIKNHYRDCHGTIIPNWSLRNTKNDQLIVPKVDKHSNKLLTDYLLITVVPNILTRQAIDTEKKIIIIAGTHGVGTNSLELVLKNNKILTNILAKVKGFHYWQALIEIDRVYYDELNEKRPIPFSVSENVVVVPVNINKYRLDV